MRTRVYIVYGSLASCLACNTIRILYVCNGVCMKVCQNAVCGVCLVNCNHEQVFACACLAFVQNIHCHSIIPRVGVCLILKVMGQC